METILVLLFLSWSSFLVNVSGAPPAGESCDAVAGVLCYPTACMNNSCSINKNATCIPDRCGCEARFFLQSTTDALRDITAICGNFNAVQKILTFHQPHDETADTTNDESVLPEAFSVPLHLKVNLGLAQLLENLAQALRIHVQHHSDIKRIFVLRQANNALRSLRRARIVLVQAQDEQNDDAVDAPNKKKSKKSEKNAVNKESSPSQSAEIKKETDSKPDFSKLFSASSELLQKAFDLNNQIIQEIVKQGGVFRDVVMQSDVGNITADKEFLASLIHAMKGCFGGNHAAAEVSTAAPASTAAPISAAVVVSNQTAAANKTVV